MKKMVCEMCNGSEFTKEGEFFVCQYCGVKYAPEAAKKLLVEGTVKVDHSEELENSLANARRAMKLEDWAGAEKFYMKVLERDSENYEAVFYQAYTKVKMALVTPELFQRQAAFRVLHNAIHLLGNIFSVEKAEEYLPVLIQISKDIIAMAGSDFVYNSTVEQYGKKLVTVDDRNATIRLYNEVCWEYAQTLEQMALKHPQEMAKMRVMYYRMAIDQCDFILQDGCQINRWMVRDAKKRYLDIVAELEDPGILARQELERQERDKARAKQRHEESKKLMLPTMILTIASFVFIWIPWVNYVLPLLCSGPGLGLSIRETILCNRSSKPIAIVKIAVNAVLILAWYIHLMVRVGS